MNYSILINSCDAYSDAWPMFFYLFKKMWRSEIPKIYLNTETKEYLDDELRINTINYIDKENPQWGERLINALNLISNDYVLMLLEDFYFEEYIKTEIIDDCIKELENNDRIMAFQLIPNGEFENPGFQAINSDGFEQRKKFSLYTVSASPTIWRKSDLINITKKIDNPWEWEFFGSKRTWFYGKQIYCWTNKKISIFKYDVVHGGAIHRGKWVGYKMEELASRFNYNLEYGSREIVYDWIAEEKQFSIIPKHKRIKSIVFNRVRSFLNIIYGIYLRYKLKISKILLARNAK